MEKIFGLVILFLVPYLAHTQQNEQFFDHQNLSQIIQTIEHQTSYTFNYNPQQLAQYYFTGTFDFKDVSTALKKLLQDTPFTFEQGEHSILIFQAEAQTYRLCGYVKDRLSGATLPLANIYMDQSTQGTQSDKNGYFDYSFTALKNQKIVVSYVGYLAQIVDVHSFEEGQCQDVLLVIDEQSLHSEIIVTDYLLDAITEGENYSSVRIDYQNSSSRQTNVEQDVLRTVQLISGVSSTDESASNISIRGNVPDQNLIVWEGATLYDAGHVFGLVSAINPFLVENISVYKGVFDPSYDNRVGGIIDIQLSDSLSNRFRGGIGSTMTEAHAYLNTPIIKDKLSLLLGVRNTIADLAYTPTLQSYTVRVFQDTKVEESLEDEETQSGHELNYHDWNAKLIFQATDRLSIKASILRNLNDYNFSADFFEDRLTSNDNLNTTASAFGLSAAMRWNDKISSEWAFRSSNTQNEYYFNIFNDTRTYYSNHLQNGIIDQSFLWTNDFQKGKNWAYRLGYEYNFKAVEFSIETTDLFEPNYNDFNFLQGSYHHLIGTFQYQNQKLQINAGLRNTYDVEVQDLRWSPRLNLQYAFHKNWKWKTSLGVLQQYISQIRDFGYNDLGLSNLVWVLSRIEGNHLQEARKIASGFLYQNKGWLLDAEAYFNRTTDLHTVSPIFDKVDTDLEYSTGSSTAIGLDILFKKNWSHYTFWVNYALSKTDFYFPDIQDTPFPSTNDQRHQLSIINILKWKDWNMILNYQFRSGLPFSEARDFIEMYDEEANESYYSLEFDRLHNKRLPDYHRLDWSLVYRHAFAAPKFTFEAAFSIQNLLNHENIFSRNFFLDLNEDVMIEPEIFSVDRLLLRRTPQVLVRVWW